MATESTTDEASAKKYERDEKYNRVLEMLLDDDSECRWASSEDKEAVRHVCGLVNVLADELAKYEGTTVPDVLRQARETIERDIAECEAAFGCR